MGRKKLPESERKKERRLYLTDAEWELVQDCVNEMRVPEERLPTLAELEESLPGPLSNVLIEHLKQVGTAFFDTKRPENE